MECSGPPSATSRSMSTTSPLPSRTRQLIRLGLPNAKRSSCSTDRPLTWPMRGALGLDQHGAAARSAPGCARAAGRSGRSAPRSPRRRGCRRSAGARLARPEIGLADQVFQRVGVRRKLQRVAGQPRGMLDNAADAGTGERARAGARARSCRSARRTAGSWLCRDRWSYRNPPPPGTARRTRGRGRSACSRAWARRAAPPSRPAGSAAAPASSSPTSRAVRPAIRSRIHDERSARFSVSQANGLTSTLCASRIRQPPFARCSAPALISVKSVTSVPNCARCSTRPTRLDSVGWSS